MEVKLREGEINVFRLEKKVACGSFLPRSRVRASSEIRVKPKLASSFGPLRPGCRANLWRPVHTRRFDQIYQRPAAVNYEVGGI